MFCPNCKDEFREGFTRCEGCNVDLVYDLDHVEPEAPPASALPVQMAEYCGFLELDDARHSRDELRRQGIRCDIVVREPVDADLNQPAAEEYWLRVDSSRVKEAAVALGDAG